MRGGQKIVTTTKGNRRAAADAYEIEEVATALSTALVKSGVIGALVETDRDDDGAPQVYVVLNLNQAEALTTLVEQGRP
jgi:hypothetical protein